jgi:hypothetical protein
MRRISYLRYAIAVVIAITSLTSLTWAGEMHLRWEPVEGAVGYRIYYGTRSGVYDQSFVAGNATSGVLSGLADCTSYYAVVKGYNGAGESPEFSNEIRGWARPELTGLDRTGATQSTGFAMSVVGVNFEPGAELDWGGTAVPTDFQGNPLIRFESSKVLSCTEMQILVTLESPIRGFRAMPIGLRTMSLVISNPDRASGTVETTLNVRFNRTRADINRSDSATIGRVDGQDLAWLAYSYGTDEAAPRFNADADLDGDGLVDGNDLALLAPAFGSCWTGTNWSVAACP